MSNKPQTPKDKAIAYCRRHLITTARRDLAKRLKCSQREAIEEFYLTWHRLPDKAQDVLIANMKNNAACLEEAFSRVKQKEQNNEQ